jgi:hypothetical protein
MEDILRILNDVKNGKDISVAYERITEIIEEHTISTHDINNKLSGIVTMIWHIDKDRMDIDSFQSSINTSKKAINYLAKRKVFKNLLG